MGSHKGKTETELKLIGCINNQLKYAGDMAESVLNKLIEALKLLDITCDSTPMEIKQHDIYFDTPQQHIQQAKGSLRIRIKGKDSFLTVKQPLDAHSALSRTEIEFPIDLSKGDKLSLVTPQFQKYFPEFRSKKLTEILEVINQRHCIPIQTAQGKYDLCFDKYHYYCASSGEKSEPFYEIEIEQEDGAEHSITDDPDIIRLSSMLTALLGFQVNLTSKYAKGTQWLQNKDKDDYAPRIFVLFDFVSYSRKPAYLQRKLVLEFTQMIQPMLDDVDCIKIPIGDGMIVGFAPTYNIVVFLHNFFLRLHTHNKDRSEDTRLDIRTSLHYGLIYEYTDVNGNNNYAGDGINIVARIGSQTEPHQILMSDECYSYLNNTGRIQNGFASDTREITVKHGVTVTVRNYRDDRANAGIPHDLFC